MKVLQNDNQSAWIMISTSLSKQMEYWLTLQYPSDILEAAAALDTRLWRALEQVAGQPRIPRREEGLGVECAFNIPDVPELHGYSYQRCLIAQPVKLGGLGLRSLVETSPVAFIGGIEMSIPYLVGVEGEEAICHHLKHIIGSLEGPERWRDFIEAGSRTSAEFSQSWKSLTKETNNMWTYLEKEPSGILNDSVLCVGGTSIDGSTRKKILEQREGLRHETLSKALALHHDREARPVMVFPNISDDKSAGRWLLAIPSLDLGMSAPVFKEAMSAHLCLPSPAIRDGGWEGKSVGSKGIRIDKFGDSVMNCSEIGGDTWRH